MSASIAALVVTVLVIGLLPLSGRAKATASVDGNELRVVPVGLAKMWAARGHVAVPARAVQSVEVVADPPPLGWRVAGTGVPGVCRAGYFRGGGTKTFAVVGRSRPLVEITLSGAKYDRIVFSANDPDALVRSLRTTLGSPTSDQATRRRA
ncbi:MAG: hypothetical protein QOG90_844 [Actinomycetota bacterium]